MKKSLLILLGMMMILWLTACGGDDNSEEAGKDTGNDAAEEKTDENTETETETEAGGEDVTLRIAWWGFSTTT
ncbi:hypothetical protein JCM21714_1832 [Gracilibacillus boraciitolerans JCM 21714]|uniref:ABC transporter substrate-binding protein n=1 Tax=Gracilibacillus boraciitolerans JCM 21714 TaxID=1298598 RepID=W4VJ24_9BACI|nr:hypothetical protein [Gracilibacillus boraciitolerans]GAE92813.1 hypothetical protein JCM21714_1832 [Gracilibacillus boraciitolerans JCM 21714]